MGAVEKLNKTIEKYQLRIENLEREIEEAREELSEKLITKADFKLTKDKHQRMIRDIRTAITRKEKARYIIENKIRDNDEKKRKKREEKEKKRKEKERLRKLAEKDAE